MVNKAETLYAIVGASSGLGKALVKDLSSRGHNVAGTYNSSSSTINGVEFAMKCDVTNEQDLCNFASACFEHSSRVILVYLAGLSVNAFAQKLDLNDWDRVIGVCLTGAFLATKAFLPQMRASEWGRIVYAGSVVGRLGFPGTSAYASAKEGLKGLTRTIAKENAQKGITVNCLELGYFDAGLTYTIPEAIRVSLASGIPAKHFGDPSNLCESVLYISAADYLNGSVLSVSGGL